MRIALDLPPGIVGDDTTFSAAGRWADGDNVRFWRGKPQVIGGWAKMISTALSGVCRSVFVWTDNDANLHYAFGTHTHLQLVTGGELFNITPSGLAAGAVDGGGEAGYGTGTYGTGDYGEPQLLGAKLRTWSFGAWGQELVANPRGGTIYTWQNNTASLATAVTNAPAEVTSILVSQTDQLFALGCSEEVSGSYNPSCIRHSSVRDNTEWNTTSATTAREYILPGGARIVSGRKVGAYLLVWTTNALFLGTFVGDPGQIWRFDQVGEKCGLVGPNAAVVVGQSAYWLAPDLQFRSYSLGGAVELVPSPIRDGLADNLAPAQEDKIVASSISSFGEVRFDYPDSRDGTENSRYVAVSLLDGAWYRGTMARSAMTDAGPAQYPLGVSPDSYAYWHELGQDADGGVLSYSLRTADQYLSEDMTGMVRGLWPDIQEQVGAMSVTLTSRLKPQGDEKTQTQTMSPGDDKVDLRLHGRLFNVEFSGSSAPAYMRLGKPVFDFAPAGGR